MIPVSFGLIYSISLTPIPKLAVTFRLRRDGSVTSSKKYIRIYRDWDSASQVVFALETSRGQGEYTQTIYISQAFALAQSLWLVSADDVALPKITRASYLNLGEGGTFQMDITQGDSNSGDPATVEALVKVDGGLANREVLIVEKPSDGNWRIAGYGTTVDGGLSIPLKVTDGERYAIGLDDWGIAFQAGLPVAVGRTIRPSTYTGWLFRITEAGTLPLTEPTWWAAEGDNAPRQLGTARAVAVRYYAPIAHGPFPVTLT